MKLACLALFLVTTGLLTPTVASSRPIACNELEESEDDKITVSVKYKTREARDVIWSIADKAMQLDFISRVVADTHADKATSLCQRNDIDDIEIISEAEKDSALHRLLEVWRVYHYVLGGRFDISALNFSQGVRTSAVHKAKSGERTIAEALDTTARKVAPVFVAAGNAGTVGLSDYTDGSAVFPVAATQDHGQAIFPLSSRPDADSKVHRVFLFADGAPRQESAVDGLGKMCPTAEHLTVGQMLLPEEAGIDAGGSSFATFAATATACPVHQYLQIVNAYLSATRAVGEVQLDPFIAYYVDNPISPACPALINRLADRREKYVAYYKLTAPQKARIQDMFFGNSVEFNLRYSPPILQSFYRSLPERRLVEGYEGGQRYVSIAGVLNRLREMTFTDWLEIGANKSSFYYRRWRDAAAKDSNPLLSGETIDAIAEYCRAASLFIVLPDIANSRF